MFRQGDVLVIRVPELPEGMTAESGPIVLAEGEATGHAHTITSGSAKLFSGQGKRFLVLGTKATLRHQEHAPICLAAGVYEVRRQQEYSPEAIRNVAD